MCIAIYYLQFVHYTRYYLVLSLIFFHDACIFFFHFYTHIAQFILREERDDPIGIAIGCPLLLESIHANQHALLNISPVDKQ